MSSEWFSSPSSSSDFSCSRSPADGSVVSLMSEEVEIQAPDAMKVSTQREHGGYFQKVSLYIDGNRKSELNRENSHKVLCFLGFLNALHFSAAV